MLKITRLFILSLLLTHLTACTSFLHAVTSGPINNNPGERSTGAFFDDEKLEIIVGVNLKKAHPDLEARRISIVSFNGVILLIGQVNSKTLHTLAGKTATTVLGVRQVHNELEVKPEISFFRRTGDGWLSTKVKTKLLALENTPGGRIKVVSENSTVYLMGLVSREEAHAASEVARHTSGVKKVVKAFEYIN